MPQHPPYPGYGATAESAPTNALAVVSLVSALVWACGAGSLIAIITGHIARHQIKGSGGRQGGGGLALAGLIVGYLGVAAVVAVVLLVVLLGRSTEVEGQLDDAFANAAVRIDLEDAAAAQEAWYQENGTYTSSVAELEAAGFFALDGSVYQGGSPNLEVIAGETGYCIEATAASGATFHHDSSAGPGDGPCPAAQGGSAGRTES